MAHTLSARLQLSARRSFGRGRARAVGEARPHPRAPRRGRGSLRGAARRGRRCRAPVRRRRRPQALVVRLRRPPRRGPPPKGGHGEARRAGNRVEALPPVHSPAALLARALRDERGHVPRLGGPEPPLARTPLPHAAPPPPTTTPGR